MDWTGMPMEGQDFAKNRRIISARRFRFTCKPAENVAVLSFKQEFIIIKFATAKVADFVIDETAK